MKSLKLERLTLHTCTCGSKPVMKFTPADNLYIQCPTCGYTLNTLSTSPYKLAHAWNKDVTKRLRKSFRKATHDALYSWRN